MRPNFAQIRSFLTIAKLGSFTRAARALNLSQPALTIQIRQLESILNVKLLDRSTRSVHLTRTGRELVPLFERVLNELDAVIAGVTGLASKNRGVVRLACLPSFAAAILPAAIVSFRRHHPGIQIMLKDGVGRKIVQLVKSETVDFGIAGGHINDPELETAVLMEDRLHAIYLAPHALERERKITAESLSRFPLIMMDGDSTVRQVTDAAFLNSGLTASPAFEATYMSTAVGMARARLGVALLPSTSAEARASGRLRSRPIEGKHFRRSILVVRKKGRSLPPASEGFLALLTAMK